MIIPKHPIMTISVSDGIFEMGKKKKQEFYLPESLLKVFYFILMGRNLIPVKLESKYSLRGKRL